MWEIWRYGGLLVLRPVFLHAASKWVSCCRPTRIMDSDQEGRVMLFKLSLQNARREAELIRSALKERTIA